MTFELGDDTTNASWMKAWDVETIDMSKHSSLNWAFLASVLEKNEDAAKKKAQVDAKAKKKEDKEREQKERLAAMQAAKQLAIASANSDTGGDKSRARRRGCSTRPTRPQTTRRWEQ